MDRDFKDLLSIFNAHSVRYLIIGGYAFIRYAEVRTTKDLDLFVEATPASAPAVYRALAEFGANLRDVTAADFSKPGIVLQIGVVPQRVDILTKIDGLTFEQAWTSSEAGLADDEIPVRYISADSLITNKLAAGRPQDLLDVQRLRDAKKARR